MSTFRIGRYVDGVNGLHDVRDDIGEDPTPSGTLFLEYSEKTADTLSGKPNEQGPAKATWYWGMLNQSQFDRLFYYCSGASAPVYIQTRVNSGSSYSFGLFRAIMRRPQAKSAPGLLRLDVTVEFSSLATPP